MAIGNPCRPGDLAYVTGEAETPGLAGRFVIVEELRPSGCYWLEGFWYGNFADELGWICRAATAGATLPVMGVYVSCIDEVARRPIDDSVLIPIRDPGPEAVDETLQRLPAPPLATRAPAVTPATTPQREPVVTARSAAPCGAE